MNPFTVSNAYLYLPFQFCFMMYRLIDMLYDLIVLQYLKDFENAESESEIIFSQFEIANVIWGVELFSKYLDFNKNGSADSLWGSRKPDLRLNSQNWEQRIQYRG